MEWDQDLGETMEWVIVEVRDEEGLKAHRENPTIKRPQKTVVVMGRSTAMKGTNRMRKRTTVWQLFSMYLGFPVDDF